MKRKDWLLFLIPITFILLGVACFALVWKMQVPWISWTGGILGFIFLYLGLFFLSNIIDHWYNTYLEKNGDGSGEPKFHPSLAVQKRLYYVAAAIFILLLTPLTLSGSKVENYLDWKQFVMDLVIIGGLLSFLSLWIYMKRYKIAFSNEQWDEQVKIAVFFAPLLVLLHLTVWYNHLSPSPVLRQTKAVVDDTGSRYVHLRFEDQRQRFKFKHRFNDSLMKGDTIVLTIRQGALNYAYVSEAVKIRK